MSEMKHDSKFQGEIEKQIADHRAERASAAVKASEQRVATDGFPIQLDDGSEVMIVRKAFEGQRLVCFDADGNGYVRAFSGKYEAAVSVKSAAPAEEPEAETTEEGESE